MSDIPRPLLAGLAIVAVCLPSPAVATTPLEQLQSDLAVIRAELQEQRQWRTEQTTAMAKLIADQTALLAAMNPQNKVLADKWLPTADEARANLKSRVSAPDALKHLPEPLREKLKACVISGVDARVPSAGQPFDLNNCDPTIRSEVERGLLDVERQANDAYQTCRDAIARDAAEYRRLLPQNPRTGVSEQALEALKKYPRPNIRECADKVQRAAEQLKDVADAKDLFSGSMQIAANVCFASGGNPYVCGGMLAVAILMKLLDGGGGGGGDGKEQGKGKGPPPGGAGGGMPVVSTSSKPEAKEDREARERNEKQAIEAGPSANLGKSANLGTPGVVSDAQCNGAEDEIRCFIRNKDGSERIFSGQPAISQLARAPRQSSVTVCGPTTEIHGIALVTTGGVRAFAYNEAGSKDLGVHKDVATACAKIKQ